MVTYIYEKLSNNLHKYCMPSIHSDNGMNISNFTLNGYFVLCPDISYTINEPGKSALDCVTAAINKAQTKGNIDSKRLGLIGHSFGGYEVTYILGQCKIFKAAVAGAPVTDLRSHYLLVNSRGRPNLDNFEGYQYRITLPFYDPKFEANSPVAFADKIKTPLLIWTSDRDPVVSSYQSIEL
jgi:dipeptidyl aminopeptidase/acylaminoacyl peptidase